MVDSFLKGLHSRWISGTGGAVAAGLAAMAAYAFFGLSYVPLPFFWVDTEHFVYFAKVNFDFASSIVDLSGMSPHQGMGGLIQPLAVWLNPMYLFSHLFPSYDPRLWGLLPVMLLMLAGTYLLARSLGVPRLLALIGAQLLTMVAFPPMYQFVAPVTMVDGAPISQLNASRLYTPVPGVALPVALEIIWLAIFCFLGTMSTRRNIAALVAFPAVFVYCVLCDPLYTALYIIPVVAVMAGVYLGSGSKRVFLWRTAGGAALLAVCLVLKLPQFYRALTGYSARAVFPNELYTEIQRWDLYTGMIFQGGWTTGLMFLMMAGCVVLLVWGTVQTRWFAASVLAYSLGLVVVSLVYVYSGVRWNLPLPVYLETGIQAAYLAVILLALCCLAGKAWPLAAARLPERARAAFKPKLLLALCYGAALLVPLYGAFFIRSHRQPGFTASTAAPRRLAGEPVGVFRTLKESIAITPGGRFRGSVANIAGMPGGDVMLRRGVGEQAPFTRQMLEFLCYSLRDFDSNFFLTGLWSQDIPTLEDNTHLVTPPFHYLVSRALSRPQDYHSRNWAWISKADPKLMAGLGARFLLADRDLSDPLLRLAGVQGSRDGSRLRLYEIRDPNLGDASPTRTILSTSADQTLALMTSSQFSFREVAVVHDAELSGLTRAESGAMYYERGGVRVRASSAGKSLLVLPLQFSNSLRIVSADNGSSVPVRLLRVNLLETGVLFEGRIDIKIAHVFGPFRGVEGRRRDIEDSDRLGIRENGQVRYPPGFQPLAGKWPRYLAPLAGLAR